MAQVCNKKLNVIIRKDKTKRDLSGFLHKAVGSPVLSTLLKAVDNGHFVSFPGFTNDLFKKHLPPSVATPKGHLNQERQKTQSTSPASTDYKATLENIKKNFKKLKRDLPSDKNSREVVQKEILDDAFPLSVKPNVKTASVIYALVRSKDGLGYIDLTGRFPVKSSSGNQYIFLLYDYDSNTIHTRPLRSRKGSAIVEAFKSIYDLLVSRGLKPKLMKLDNEASHELQRMLKKNKIKTTATAQRCPGRIGR